MSHPIALTPEERDHYEKVGYFSRRSVFSEEELSEIRAAAEAVHQRVLDAGEKASGCTVHFVRSEMDTGPIIVQAEVPVRPDDDAEALAARVLEQEHKIYPRALRLIAEDRVTVEGERALIDGQ